MLFSCWKNYANNSQLTTYNLCMILLAPWESTCRFAEEVYVCDNIYIEYIEIMIISTVTFSEATYRVHLVLNWHGGDMGDDVKWVNWT